MGADRVASASARVSSGRRTTSALTTRRRFALLRMEKVGLEEPALHEREDPRLRIGGIVAEKRMHDALHLPRHGRHELLRVRFDGARREAPCARAGRDLQHLDLAEAKEARGLRRRDADGAGILGGNEGRSEDRLSARGDASTVLSVCRRPTASTSSFTREQLGMEVHRPARREQASRLRHRRGLARLLT